MKKMVKDLTGIVTWFRLVLQARTGDGIKMAMAVEVSCRSNMGPMMDEWCIYAGGGEATFAMVQTKELRAMFRQGLLYVDLVSWQPLLQ